MRVLTKMEVHIQRSTRRISRTLCKWKLSILVGKNHWKVIDLNLSFNDKEEIDWEAWSLNFTIGAERRNSMGYWIISLLEFTCDMFCYYLAWPWNSIDYSVRTMENMCVSNRAKLDWFKEHKSRLIWVTIKLIEIWLLSTIT